MRSGVPAVLGILGILSASIAHAEESRPPDPPANPESRNTIDGLLIALSASEGSTRLQYAQALARALAGSGRTTDAAALLRREIDRAQARGVDADSVAVARTDLSIRLLLLGHAADGYELAVKAERQFATSRPGAQQHVAALLALGRTLNALGELEKARLALTSGEAAATKGNFPVLLAQIAEAQAHLALLRGDGVSAIPLYEKVVLALSARPDVTPARLAQPVTGLADAQQLAGDFERSEASFRRAIQLAASDDTRSNQASAIRIELARLYTATGRFDAAVQTADSAYRDTDTGTEAGRAQRGLAASARGFARIGLGDIDAAREDFAEGIATTVAVRGSNSPDLPPGYIELARIDLAQSRPAEAEHHAAEAERILLRQTPDAPLLAEVMSLRAEALAARGKLVMAVRTARDAVAVLSRRSTLYGASVTSVYAAMREQVVRRSVYERMLDISYAASGREAMLAPDIFAAAQGLHLGAAGMSISQLAARQSAGNGAIAGLLGQRRDTFAALRAAEKQLDEHRAADRMEGADSARLEARRAELTAQAARLDKELAQDFPKIAEMLRPQAVEMSELKRALRPGEAFLLQATTPQATHLWLITGGGGDPLYARTELGADDLKSLASSIQNSVKMDGIPYDARAAYALYRALLAPFSEVLTGTRTLIASMDRQVQALPLAMLVATDPGSERDPTKFDFLVRHALATVWAPSPASLVALRSMKLAGTAARPFLGIGNPVLLGDAGQQQAALERIFSRMSASADPDDLRQLEPISDAQSQLEAMAAIFDPQARGRHGDALLVGVRATENVLKATTLSDYRVIAFATHGLTAGKFAQFAEPGLVMTPPKTAYGSDDGLLTASEISALSFNADLVILSACDTAASDGSFTGEGLSGLASAFYYAGARSLLVSGWPVKAEAADPLTTGMMRNWVADPSSGKAEALRRSMLAMLEGPDWILRHPIYWASFVIAGEPE